MLEQSENTKEDKKDNVVDFFKRDKEAKELKEALSLLIKRQDKIEENMAALLERVSIPQQNQTQPPPPYPYIPQQKTENPFAMIKEFAEAMKSLSSYENSVLEKYRNLQKETKTDILSSIGNINNEESEELEPNNDALLLKILEKIPFGNKPQEQNHQTQKESTQPMKYDIETIKRLIPQKTKKDIKSGKLSLIEATNNAQAEAKKYNIMLSDADIEKVYNEIKKE